MEAIIMAIGTAVGFVLSKGVDALLAYLRGKSDIRTREQKTAGDAWRDYALHQEDQNDRRDCVIRLWQQVAQSMAEDIGNYREEVAEYRQSHGFLYEALKRVHAHCKDPYPLPELPEIKERPGRSDQTRFLINQALQAAMLLRKADEVIKGENSGGGGRGGDSGKPPTPAGEGGGTQGLPGPDNHRG